MSDTEYHIVLTCPEHWPATSVTMLADRLASFEVPKTVGVFVWRLDEGKISEQTVVREAVDE